MGRLVGELMAPAYSALPADATVAEAASWMRDHQDADIAVCTTAGRFLGLVSAHDLLYRSVALGDDPRATPVGKVVDSRAEHLTPSDTIEDATRMVLDHHWRALPVVENDRLVGMLGLDQITGHLLPEDRMMTDGPGPYRWRY